MSFLKSWEMFIDDYVHTIGLTGSLGGIVSVTSRTVPVTGDWLRFKDNI